MSKSSPQEAAVRPDEPAAEAPRKRGPVAWMLGWVGIPVAVFGSIFTGGVVVGANFHDSWVTRAFVWLFR